jgi:hypothetical protein
LDNSADKGMPLLIRFSGDREALDRLVAAAPGPDDIQPVDFDRWARTQEVRVRAGLDPVIIEDEIAEDLRGAGCDDPGAAMKATFAGAELAIKARLLRTVLDNQDFGHGFFILPPSAVDPTKTPGERRAAFGRMIDALDRDPVDLEDRRRPVPTAFSLSSLAPLPPAVLVPNWFARYSPFRGGDKHKTWSLQSGLHNAVVDREADGSFNVCGWAECTLVPDLWQIDRLLIGVTKRFGISAVATTWGEQRQYSEGLLVRKKESLGGFFVSAVTEKHGIRSREQMVHLMTLGRHRQAVAALNGIAHRLHHPGVIEIGVGMGLTVGSAAIGLHSRIERMLSSHGRRRAREKTASSERTGGGLIPPAL